MFELEQRVTRLLAACETRRLRLATAESCSGGALAAAITSHPGSSAVFVGTVVAYADAAKITLLAVPAELLAQHGAVSQRVALEMASGIVAKLGVDLGLAITGIAGPAAEGKKPVGLVHIAAASGGESPPLHRECQFHGGRNAVRLQSALEAVELGLRLINAD